MKNLRNSLLAVSFALLLRADFQPSSWNYRRPLPVEAGSPLTVFNLDRQTYVHSQPDLADLRVVRGQDEVPYVLDKMSGSRQLVEVSSNVLNQGVTTTGDLELTVDVGVSKRHNGIRLATPRTNFRQRVSVATSDDGRTWTRVRDDGYIFDFSQDASHVSVSSVSYPVSSRRYVRLTVYGWNDPKSVTGCWVSLEESTSPVRDVMASLKAEPEQEPKTQSTLYTWDLGSQGIPHDELTLEIEAPGFYRAAVVESSGDGKQWYPIGQGVLWRFPKDQSLTLDFPQSHEQYLRLRIYNRDDRPLTVKAATIAVIQTRVKFQTGVAGSYALYYGNADAHTPAYDLRDLLAREAPRAEVAVSAGAEERNPAYREKAPPAKPWSEQHPEVLYVTLALAVVGMGFVTVRFLRKVGAENR